MAQGNGQWQIDLRAAQVMSPGTAFLMSYGKKNHKRHTIVHLTPADAEAMKEISTIFLYEVAGLSLPRSFARLAPTLCGLYVRASNLSTFLLPRARSFVELTDVNLRDNDLRAVPACLQKLPRLNFLCVAQNKISTLDRWLARLTCLMADRNLISEWPFHLVTPGEWVTVTGDRATHAIPQGLRLGLNGNPCCPRDFAMNGAQTSEYMARLMRNDEARMTVLVMYIFYPRWLDRNKAGAVEVVSRNSAFDRNLVRFIWTFLSTAVTFKDRQPEE